ncbi:MAG: hypothetical protein IT365_19855 [Candidatus Hydrogenedentes bacterium]|nr:hypothetical protein [Candidatus Hydrogenedentota bacterium]
MDVTVTPQKTKDENRSAATDAVGKLTPDELLVRFRERYAAYSEEVRKVVHLGGGAYMDLWRTSTRSLDSDLRSLIHHCVESDWDVCRQTLGAVLDIQEIPEEWISNLCDEEHLFLCTNSIAVPITDLKPIVIFRRRDMEDGEQVYVFQNAFVTAANMDYALIRGEPYAIVKTNRGATMSGVTNEYEQAGSYPPVNELPDVIVDLVDVGEPFPVAVCISGPQGEGEFVRMSTYVFSKDDLQWRPRGIGGEWDGAQGWSYSAPTTVLSVSGEKVDLKELIRSYPLGKRR